MTVETFFEKFELFSDAPDAVGKMRELVLGLAVRGKLVCQDVNEEPAKDLVARVAAALPDRRSENPFLNNIECSITDESEFELPLGWTWMPLGHLGIWATGCGFPLQYQGKNDGEFMFCKVSDMNLPGNEVEIRATVHSIDAEVMKTIRARANPVGTVIFPKIGGAIATHKRRLVIKPTIIDNNCSGIQPIGLTDHRWLLLLMRNLDMTKYQSGTSVPAVSQGALDPIRVGLPPLAEQKRIVAKVDELMGLCDRLAAQQQEREQKHAALSRAALARFAEAPTPANLEYLFHESYTIDPTNLRKSILTLAVQGKLVEQDEGDGDARRLFKDISVERAQRGLRTPKEQATEDPTLPFDIPDTWIATLLGRVALQIQYGYTASADPSIRDVRMLRITDIQNNRVNWETVPGCQIDEAETEKYLLAADDILIARTGGTIGKSFIVPHSVVKSVFASYLIRVTPPNALDARYVKVFLESPLYWDQLREMSAGTGQPNVNGQALARLALPLPPLAEQKRIVAKVEALMALVDRLEAQQAQARDLATRLLSAAVAELTAEPGKARERETTESHPV